jgi:ElaB/YqjD/DUF883 family membrane-anchored ribosome-binding protein
MTTDKTKKAVAESREKLVEDLKAIIADAQDLAGGAKDLSTEAFSEKAAQTRAKLKDGTDALRDYERKFVDQANECTHQAEEKIRQYPWQALGIATVAGLIIGRFCKCK